MHISTNNKCDGAIPPTSAGGQNYYDYICASEIKKNVSGSNKNTRNYFFK